MDQSVGVVKTQSFEFAKAPDFLPLDSGEKLSPVTLAYETYGNLNAKKSNAILICHALSGDAHVAGKHSADDEKTGWWDMMIGPGKAFDTNRYFVICSNVIGGCKGSTGPGSIRSQTGKPYALEFPVITVRDMVRAQKTLIDSLNIEKLLTVVGGSLGGMQVLQWAVSFPERLVSLIPIATTHRLSAQGIALNEVQRQAILHDPDWNKGKYTKETLTGLSIARMIGHISYLSDEAMHHKFGRELRNKEKFGYDFSTDFEVESYLHHQGIAFTKRFDANSYLYMTKAMDYFDLAGQYGSLKEAFRQSKIKYLVISFSSDWLFPPYQSLEVVQALKINNHDVSYCEIKSAYGHDAFLVEREQLTRLIHGFLKSLESYVA